MKKGKLIKLYKKAVRAKVVLKKKLADCLADLITEKALYLADKHVIERLKKASLKSPSLVNTDLHPTHKEIVNKMLGFDSSVIREALNVAELKKINKENFDNYEESLRILVHQRDSLLRTSRYRIKSIDDLLSKQDSFNATIRFLNKCIEGQHREIKVLRERLNHREESLTLEVAGSISDSLDFNQEKEDNDYIIDPNTPVEGIRVKYNNKETLWYAKTISAKLFEIDKKMYGFKKMAIGVVLKCLFCGNIRRLHKEDCPRPRKDAYKTMKAYQAALKVALKELEKTNERA